jgi:hypothetical protein
VRALLELVNETCCSAHMDVVAPASKTSKA